MKNKSEQSYMNMIKQPYRINLYSKDYVSNDNDIAIYKYKIDNVTRYYIKLNDALKYFNIKSLHSEYFEELIFFPNIIYAREDIKSSKKRWFIELDKEVFGMHKQLRKDLRSVDFFINKINIVNDDNTIINSTTEETVTNNIVIETDNMTEDNDSNTIIICGETPLNYNELIEELNLKDNYGAKVSNEVEDTIKQFISKVKYEVKIPKRSNSDITKDDLIKLQERITELEFERDKAFDYIKDIVDRLQNNFDYVINNIPNDILRKFIVEMQQGGFGKVSKELHAIYNKYAYVNVCEKLIHVHYIDDWHEGGIDIFEQNNVLYQLARFYIRDIMIENYAYYRENNTIHYFNNAISESYGYILINNIKTFILKPMGLPQTMNYCKKIFDVIVKKGIDLNEQSTIQKV